MNDFELQSLENLIHFYRFKLWQIGNKPIKEIFNRAERLTLNKYGVLTRTRATGRPSTLTHTAFNILYKSESSRTHRYPQSTRGNQEISPRSRTHLRRPINDM